tara:strand:+ start:724 stop:921 length:198 start_codon:yes stop_codon:yes gene_type:complete
MVGGSVSLIEVGGILYKVVRTLKADHINMVDGWKDTMMKLYHADNIFQKDGVLYVVQEITDVHPI